MADTFPPTTGLWPNFSTTIQHCTRNIKAIRQEKSIRGIKIRKEVVKVSV